MSNGIGRVWAVNAEGGDEGRPNGVGPVYIENADQLGSKLPEPAAGDAGKVLGVLNSSGDIGWVEDQSGTLTQIQSDWDEDDSSQVSYIQNKPTLAAVATSGSYADLSNKPTIPTVDQVYDSTSANAQSGVAVASAISGKQDTISDLETIRSGAAAGATAVQPSQLATVATSGSYNDLSNKPSIPAAQVQSDWNQANDQAVDYIKNKPSIPAAQVNSDWNAASGVAQILNKPSLATVATSGSYADLYNKPTIPTVDQSYSASSTNAQSGVAVAGALATVNQVPASTSADATKVLTVNSSGVAEWTTAQGGGSSNEFVWVAGTTTNQEVYDAIAAGKDIFIHAVESGDNVVYRVYKYFLSYGTYYVYSSRYSEHGGTGNTGCMAQCVAYVAENSNVANYKSQTNVSYITDKTDTYDASSTKAMTGVAVAQAIASVPTASYTAGDGIDISAQDEISVKAGNGLTIGDYTYEHTGTMNLTATPVLNQGSYSAPYIAQLTPELLAQMNSTGGLQVTLNGAYDGGDQILLIGLATNATTYQTNLSNRVVFGSSLGKSIAAGTTVTFNFADLAGSLSTKSYADVAANVSSYYLVVFWYFNSAGYEMIGNSGTTAPSADPITTGTYTGTETVTVQNAVNLSTPIEVVASIPANPTSGVLYIVTGS